MFQPQKRKPGNSKRPLFNMYWMYALIVMSLLALYYFQDGSQTKEVDWTLSNPRPWPATSTRLR